MNPINPINSSLPLAATSPTSPIRPLAAPATTVARAADRVELSGVNRLDTLQSTATIRTDKVTAVRAQLEAGTYETDAKLNIAIGKLLDELNK